MTGPARGLCGQWQAERRAHCDDPETRRFIVGYRCRLHAPGANERTCPHGVAWTEPCERCASFWGPPGPTEG